MNPAPMRRVNFSTPCLVHGLHTASINHILLFSGFHAFENSSRLSARLKRSFHSSISRSRPFTNTNWRRSIVLPGVHTLAAFGIINMSLSYTNLMLLSSVKPILPASGRTPSLTRTLAPGFITGTRACRILIACVSDQLWKIHRNIYTSAEIG